MDVSPLLVIFVISTALIGAAYALVDRQMKSTQPAVKKAYKVGLLIVYGLQLLILLLFLF